MKKKLTLPPQGTCKFTLAVLKDVVEGGDGTRFFGSLIGWSYYAHEAERRGWTSWATKVHPEGFEHRVLVPSQEGRQAYHRAGLERLPSTGRAYAWDWHLVPDEFNDVR